MSDSLQPYGPQPARLLCPWDSPGKDTGVGCHALLQGIISTQGIEATSTYSLLHWQAGFLPQHHLQIGSHLVCDILLWHPQKTSTVLYMQSNLQKQQIWQNTSYLRLEQQPEIMLCPRYRASTALEFENDLKRCMEPIIQFCNTHTNYEYWRNYINI